MDSKDPVEKVKAAASAAYTAGDFREMERLGRELVQVSEKKGNKRGLAFGHNFIGNARLLSGDGAGADESYRKGLALFEEIGDEGYVALMLMNLGTLAVEIHLDVAEARRLYDIALPIVRRAGEPGRLALALGNAGEIFRLEGDYNQAIAYAQESRQLFQQIGEPGKAAWQLVNIAHCHSLRREYLQAAEVLQASFEVLREDQYAAWLATYFDLWFLIATEVHAWGVAARILGFADRFRDEKNVPRLQGILPWYLPCYERLRNALSDDAIEAFRAEGRELTLFEAQALAASISLEK